MTKPAHALLALATVLPLTAVTKGAVFRFLNYAFTQPTQHLVYPNHRDPLPSLRWCNRTLEEAQ